MCASLVYDVEFTDNASRPLVAVGIRDDTLLQIGDDAQELRLVIHIVHRSNPSLLDPSVATDPTKELPEFEILRDGAAAVDSRKRELEEPSLATQEDASKKARTEPPTME